MSQISADISKRLDIYARNGDTFSLDILVKNISDNSNFDFTGYSASLDIYTSISDRTANISFSAGNGLTLSSGKISITKSASYMSLIRRRDYIYFLRVNYPDSSSHLWLNGSFIINEGKFSGIDNDVEKFINNMVIIQINGTNSSSINIWDMSTDLFPANATFGYEAYGINGPTTTLVDRLGGVIPNGTICKCIKVSGVASTSSPLDWALIPTVI